MEWAFGIRRTQDGRPGSRLIHPESKFAIFMQMISMILLTYTFAFTPIAVAFFWNAPPCFRSSTLEFDLFLDTFFILEIFLRFLVGIERHGIYIDELTVHACGVRES